MKETATRHAAHWRPAEVADALRARTREPRILRNRDGVEALKSPWMGEEPLAKAFDDVDFHLGRMDRQGVEVSVLSLLGSFCWVEARARGKAKWPLESLQCVPPRWQCQKRQNDSDTHH
jgi:hypothetical protein